jgi:hypothetical protein
MSVIWLILVILIRIWSVGLFFFGFLSWMVNLVEMSVICVDVE